MKTSLLRSATSKTLLTRLIDMPDLVPSVRALPPPTFSALIRHIGVEDAGEIIALATTEQLVAAFDEDLFSNDRPGERESFESERFLTWLEVLLEAGDDVAAARIVELSDEFVIQAISSVVLVLDHDALQSRMGEGGDDADAADKAIESSLSEEIDGYLLISRKPDGWDAMLALIVALDRDHRSFLVRILDRCADMASRYLDDLDELASLLTAEESLAEDVEAEREERRGKQGYVEARAAKNFLSLSKMPLDEKTSRDPVTRAYFRDLEPTISSPKQSAQEFTKTSRLLEAMQGVLPQPPKLLPNGPEGDEKAPRIMAAIRLLQEQARSAFEQRMEEFAYLTNVIVAGASKKDGRFELAEAAEAVLATVALGAELAAMEKRGKKRKATVEELRAVLQENPADMLFRRAASSLVANKVKRGTKGFLKSFADFKAVRRILCTEVKKPSGQKS